MQSADLQASKQRSGCAFKTDHSFFCTHSHLQEDKFNITCRDIGRVRSIIVDCNGLDSNPKANWHLDYIVLEVQDLEMEVPSKLPVLPLYCSVLP